MTCQIWEHEGQGYISAQRRIAMTAVVGELFPSRLYYMVLACAFPNDCKEEKPTVQHCTTQQMYSSPTSLGIYGLRRGSRVLNTYYVQRISHHRDCAIQLINQREVYWQEPHCAHTSIQAV